jgi:tRNA-specific 2-thiouridylase
MARLAGLPVADKPDSQEICFIPDQDYAGFIRRYRGAQDTAGKIIDMAGATVGEHTGFEQFTIGQRRGLGLAFGEPRYVVELRPEARQVVIGTRADLARHVVEADRLNWLVEDPSDEIRCTAKIRYQHTPADCVAERLGRDRLRVTFDSPQHGVAPGQAVVLYDGERVLGGGWMR